MATKTKKAPAAKSVAALEKELKATLAKLAKAKEKEKAKPAAKKPAAKKAAEKKVKVKAYNPKTAKPVKKKPAAGTKKKKVEQLSKQDQVRLLVAPKKATTKCASWCTVEISDCIYTMLHKL